MKICLNINVINVNFQDTKEVKNHMDSVVDTNLSEDIVSEVKIKNKNIQFFITSFS